jgi:uncharacterized protein (TIGR02391 family)
LPLSLPEEAAVELPVDQLGLIVLKDLLDSNAWNELNYVLEAQQHAGYGAAGSRALAEALGWLRARGLTAHDPTQSGSPTAIFVTRTGERVLTEGPEVFYATERLQRGSLHPLIERQARPQFLIGKYELGVFAAFKAVEVRVRKLAGLGEDAFGTDLMNKAFGPTGPLTDLKANRSEQEGTRALFVGAHAVFRNPAGHREVDYDDVAEAAEAIQTASLLMRILDRTQKRLEWKEFISELAEESQRRSAAAKKGHETRRRKKREAGSS